MSLNGQVAERLEQIAQMLELLGEDRFRVNAHAKAARTVADLTEDIGEIAGDRERLLALPGIGAKVAEKIEQFVREGRMDEHEELRAKVPPGLLDLLEVPGLGPKTVALLWKEKGVTDIEGLKRVIKDGSILELPRMGRKTVDNIKASLAFMATSAERLSLGIVRPVADAIVERLRGLPGVKRVEAAGSLRRGRDTIGDIDILAATDDPEGTHEAFRSGEGVIKVLAAGETKSSVRVRLDTDLGRWSGAEDELRRAVQVDLRVVPDESWGAALLYFTGSKEHNVRLRERAIRAGLTLNEYGLFPDDGEHDDPPQRRGVRPKAAATEEDIYKALGLPYIPPELREDRGELELTETPRLVELDDIRAELHAHTTASDGVMSIEELAKRAKDRGFHTIAVTDHSRSSAVAGGLDAERLRAHIEAVREADAGLKGIRILAGSEVDILADGSLDYDDDLLAELDIVVASPHASLGQDRRTAMRRLLRAIEHPLVHVLGHPSGRLINRRAGLDLDIAELCAAAKASGVALEINSHWMRLDLRDIHARTAVDEGCLIAINCDVHHPDDFEHLRHGVKTARRGWLTPERCINTWTAKRLHDWFRAKRGT